MCAHLRPRARTHTRSLARSVSTVVDFFFFLSSRFASLCTFSTLHCLSLSFIQLRLGCCVHTLFLLRLPALYLLITLNKCINYSICSFQFDCRMQWATLLCCVAFTTQTIAWTIRSSHSFLSSHSRLSRHLLVRVLFLRLSSLSPSRSLHSARSSRGLWVFIITLFAFRVCARALYASIYRPSNTIISSNSNRITPLNGSTYSNGINWWFLWQCLCGWHICNVAHMHTHTHAQNSAPALFSVRILVFRIPGKYFRLLQRTESQR